MSVTFPKISGSNLEGQKFELPKDFRGKLNIVIVVFRREHQDLIEGWTSSLGDLIKKNPDLAYYELPTLQVSYSLFRSWIDGDMRAIDRSIDQAVNAASQDHRFKKVAA